MKYIIRDLSTMHKNKTQLQLENEYLADKNIELMSEITVYKNKISELTSGDVYTDIMYKNEELLVQRDEYAAQHKYQQARYTELKSEFDALYQTNTQLIQTNNQLLQTNTELKKQNETLVIDNKTLQCMYENLANSYAQTTAKLNLYIVENVQLMQKYDQLSGHSGTSRIVQDIVTPTDSDEDYVKL